MRIAFKQINQVAIQIANFFHPFDHETMFWSQQNPVLFPNGDLDGFTVPEDIRKPFGIQKILQAIAQDLGFNSYKAMTDHLLYQNNPDTEVQISIQSLNPNPRSEFYTEIWSVLTQQLLNDLDTFNNRFDLPQGFIRNFRVGESIKLMPYMGYGLSQLVSVTKNKDHLCFAPKQNEALLPFYPLVLSILSVVFDKELFKSNNVCKLADLLKSPLWLDHGASDFVDQLKLAFKVYAGIKIDIGLSHDDVMESIVIFYWVESEKAISALNIADARGLATKTKLLKEIALEFQSTPVGADTAYYTIPGVDYHKAYSLGEYPDEFTHIFLTKHNRFKNIWDTSFYGSKLFWLNYIVVVLDAYKVNLRTLYNPGIALKDYFELALLNQFEIYNQLTNDHQYYESKLLVTGIQDFLKEVLSNEDGVLFALPNSICVLSEEVLHEGLRNVFICNKISELLPFSKGVRNWKCYSTPESNILIEYHSKESVVGLEINEVFTANFEAEYSIKFDISHCIQKLTLCRFKESDYIAELYADGMRGEALDAEANVDSTYALDDLIIYDDKTFDLSDARRLYPILFRFHPKTGEICCLLKIEWSSTPYLTNNISYYNPDMVLLCEFDSLSNDLQDIGSVKLSLHLPSLQNRQDQSLIESSLDIVSELNNNERFINIVKSYVRRSSKNWEFFKYTYDLPEDDMVFGVEENLSLYADVIRTLN